MNKKAFTAGLALVASIAVAGTVSADELPGGEIETGPGDVQKENELSVNILAGEGGNGGLELDLSPIVPYEDITLTSTPTTYNTSFEHGLKVTDLRGTHAGWSLSVGASNLTSEDNHVLPSGTLTLAGLEDISNAVEGISEDTLPTITGASTHTILDDGAIPVANAEVGTGMGEHNLTFAEDALGLTVSAATAKEGTYTSTITWDLLAAPQ